MHHPRLAAYIGDRAFYKGALLIMIPVVLQQLINALFNLVDNVMVASIDALTMSAVAVANKPAMMYFALFFGFTGAASILLSQYHGAGRLDVCQRIFSVEMLLGQGLSLVFALILYLFPAQIMALFVQDSYTITVGVDYLRVAVWAYLPAALSSVCIFSLRALGINFLPMIVSIFAIAANAFFNWLLIFGHWGLPQMGVQGAALGTLLARILEMCIYIMVLLSRRTPYRLRIKPAFQIEKHILRDYIQKALPLTLNELLWSTGLILYFWAYTHIHESAVPAINVADQIFNIAWVFFMGMSSAISVMVGRNLGAGEFDVAKRNAKKLLGLGLMISFFCAGVAAVVAQSVGSIFQKLSVEHILLSKNLIYLLLCFFPANAVYVICFFLLRAGGDTRNAMLLDSVYMWLLPVPAALIMGHFFPGKIDIGMAMLLIQALMNAKVFLALFVVKRGTWLRNLTRAEA